MRTLIKNGTVISAEGAGRVDVLVDGEQVAALCASGSELAQSFEVGADRMLDASGKYVIPGGIDGHTHMEMPFGGTTAADTFATGTRAAAFGGTTTIVDFAVQTKGESLQAALDAWQAKADGVCAIDYGFHAIVSEVNESSLKEMDVLVDEGVTSFKLFMAYPGVFYATDREIYEAMHRAAGNGALIMVHAENGIAIDAIVASALSKGQSDPIFHGLTRPPELEGEAVHRAIVLAQVAGAPVYIVHVSSSHALAAVAEARHRGQNVFAETCPQYLFLSEDDMRRPGFEGAKFVCTPPLRPRPHQAALWQGLRIDDLSVVATDHCPFTYVGQKELGIGDFTKIPNGLPSLENRMDLIFQGVVAGEISVSRWVEVTSTNPAKTFGLYPKKGTISPGSDADIVIYDPLATQTISASTQHMAVDYSCYEGKTITGQHRHGAVSWSGRGREGHLHRRAPVTAGSSPAKSVSTSAELRKETTWTSGSSCKPIRRPATSSSDEAGRGRRVHPRVDFRVLRAVGGHIRHLPGHARRHLEGHRRAHGDQPRPAGLDRHRIDVRHDERDVRRSHDLWDRPGRLGTSRDRRPTDLHEGLRRVDHDASRTSPRDVRHHQRKAGPHPLGGSVQAAHVGCGLRAEGAPGDRRARRRLHPPDRRPGHHPLGRRDRPRRPPARSGRDPADDLHLRRRPGLRRRRRGPPA